MLRRLAVVVSCTSLLASGLTALEHVHEYGGHDHAEHHHGPALHAHGVREPHAAPETREHGPEIEGCDPGDHRVSIGFVCGSPEPDHASSASHAWETVALRTPVHSWTGPLLTDVRVHGPPAIANLSLRAPPSPRLA